jgi:hypothetical protein
VAKGRDGIHDGIVSHNKRITPLSSDTYIALCSNIPLAIVHRGATKGNEQVAGPTQRRAPVKEVSLALFAHGHAVFVRPHAAPPFDCHEVIRRARSRVGENRYGSATQ